MGGAGWIDFNITIIVGQVCVYVKCFELMMAEIPFSDTGATLRNNLLLSIQLLQTQGAFRKVKVRIFLMEYAHRLD